MAIFALRRGQTQFISGWIWGVKEAEVKAILSSFPFPQNRIFLGEGAEPKACAEILNGFFLARKAVLPAKAENMWRAPQRPRIRDCQPGIGVHRKNKQKRVVRDNFETKVVVEVSKGPVPEGKPEGGGGNSGTTAPLRFKYS